MRLRRTGGDRGQRAAARLCCPPPPPSTTCPQPPTLEGVRTEPNDNQLFLTCVCSSAAFAETYTYNGSEECRAVWDQQTKAWQRAYSEQMSCWAGSKCRNPGADPRFKLWTQQTDQLSADCKRIAQIERANKQAAYEASRQAEQRSAAQATSQRQIAAQLEALQLQQQREQARQPRVIADLPSSRIDNTPRIVQTPNQRQQIETDAKLAAEQRRRTEGETLRQVFTPSSRSELVDQLKQMAKSSEAVESGRRSRSDKEFEVAMSKGAAAADEVSDARRRMLDRALNPLGNQSPEVDRLVKNAQKDNGEINAARGFSPATTQIGNDAFSALGSVSNNTAAQLDSALRDTSSVGSGEEVQLPPGVTPLRRQNTGAVEGMFSGALAEASAAKRSAQAQQAAEQSFNEQLEASDARQLTSLANRLYATGQDERAKRTLRYLVAKFPNEPSGFEASKWLGAEQRRAAEIADAQQQAVAQAEARQRALAKERAQQDREEFSSALESLQGTLRAVAEQKRQQGGPSAAGGPCPAGKNLVNGQCRTGVAQ